MVRRRRVPVVLISLLLSSPILDARSPPPVPASPLVQNDNVVLRWNSALLEAIRRTRFRPMWAARALAVVHTSMFDAWAAYQNNAVGVHWSSDLRRPVNERTAPSGDRAMSMAAYRALADLFPAQTPTLFRPLMIELGLDPDDTSVDPARPEGVGNIAAAGVLVFRHADGANQLGDAPNSNGTPYSDYTAYVPANTHDALSDPNRWQPLQGADNVVQTFLAPHWGLIKPFALTAPNQFLPAPPPLYPSNAYRREVDEVREMSARLTDREKMIAEYWSDGPSTETPAGHWALLAQWVSRRDGNDSSADAVMFFALSNAMLDVSIAVWDCKVHFDYIRPISAVRFLYAGKTIQAWGGPGRGTQSIPGEKFQSYIATPPFGEYTSGHSAFSAAAAEILKLFTGNPHFGASVTFAAGSSTIEPGSVPAAPVTLNWPSFDAAADEAGMSRRFGGIHFRQGDVESRKIGRRLAAVVWERALAYLRGMKLVP
jgi:hypothetical protein